MIEYPPKRPSTSSPNLVRILDADGKLVATFTIAEFRARSADQPCVRHHTLRCRNCTAHRYALTVRNRATGGAPSSELVEDP